MTQSKVKFQEKSGAISYADLENMAKSHMAERGFILNEPLDISGKTIKFSGRPEIKEKTEWYKANQQIENGIIGLQVTYNSHHTSLKSENHNVFSSRTDNPISEAERKAELARVTKLQEQRAKQEATNNSKKAKKTISDRIRFEKASTQGTSAYLQRKKVSAHGGRFEKRYFEGKEETVFLIPMRDENGEIQALQEIYETKRIFKEGEKPRDKNFTNAVRGLFHVIGEIQNGQKIRVSEGYSTSDSVYKSTNFSIPHVVAFSAGAYQHVIPILKKLYPNSPIEICADNNISDDPNQKNTGLDEAKRVAKKFNCSVSYPIFPADKNIDEQGKYYADFNDLMLIMGAEEVQKQITNNILDIEKDKSTIETEDENEKNRTIEIRSGNIHQMTSQAEKFLIECNSGIYQRGCQLVRIVTAKSKPNKLENKFNNDGKPLLKRAGDSLLITEADTVHLCETLSKLVNWVKYDERSKQYKQKDCPDRVSSTLVSRKEWDFPVLCGIIQAPTLRADGSILEKPGYDEETGLFFNPGKTKFLPVPHEPSKKDALNALNIILELLNDFPFENEESKAVAISAILTGLIRKSINTAPLHGFTAPKMATGKSLLADIVGLIATGKPNCAIPQADNEAEEKKRILSVLSEGDPIICYDNIERPFGSPALCSVLTQSEFKDRLLGVNRSLSVPTNATFLATGNNLTFIGDISTRVILCRLDPRCERPEERSFSIDLRKYIPKNRGELVKAALTILRAYHVAERPKQEILQYGRFEEWSDWVRSSLCWLGMTDPCTSRKEVENDDPVRVSISSLFAAWYATFGDLALKASSVIEKAKNIPELQEVLKDVASNGKGEVSSVKLGQVLNKYNKRIEGGFRIEKMSKYQNADTWRVVKC